MDIGFVRRERLLQLITEGKSRRKRPGLEHVGQLIKNQGRRSYVQN